MSNDDVATQLQQLGFRVSLPALRAFFEHTTKSRIGPVEVCEKLVEMERRERDSRNLLARTRLATLGKFATLDRFDWNHPRSIDRGLYEHLHATLDFIDRGDNVLLRGQSGVGKTMLAQNLGFAALTRGYSVRFTSLAALLTDLLRRESLPALERCLRQRYLSTHILICDSCAAPGYVELPTGFAGNLAFLRIRTPHN
jgi:DNA replication protein DnaC